MKNFLTRIVLAAAVTLVALALASSARTQPSDEESAPATLAQPQSSTSPPSSQQQAQLPSSPDPQTQEALAFTGRVVQEQSQFILKDPVTKMSYQFDNQSKAKPYLGKQVKVIGKLEMNSNTIRIERIEPLS